MVYISTLPTSVLSLSIPKRLCMCECVCVRVFVCTGVCDLSPGIWSAGMRVSLSISICRVINGLGIVDAESLCESDRSNHGVTKYRTLHGFD